jgi:hypothetical protein
MDGVMKFLKSPVGAAVLTLVAVYAAETYLKTNLAGLPGAARAKAGI